MIEEVNNRTFVLLGDFNYTGIDWINNCSDSGASIKSKLFLNSVDKRFLTQHVKCLTTVINRFWAL